MHSFSPVTTTQLPQAWYRLHCILKKRRGNERKLHRLLCFCSGRQVDCARTNRQLSDLYVLIKFFIILGEKRNDSSQLYTVRAFLMIKIISTLEFVGNPFFFYLSGFEQVISLSRDFYLNSRDIVIPCWWTIMKLALLFFFHFLCNVNVNYLSIDD